MLETGDTSSAAPVGALSMERKVQFLRGDDDPWRTWPPPEIGVGPVIVS